MLHARLHTSIHMYVCENLNVFILITVYCISVKGEFSEGLMHGTGRYTWADGVIYEVILNVFIRVIYIHCEP